MKVCLDFFKKMLGEEIQFGLSPRALVDTGRETVANSGDRRQLGRPAPIISMHLTSPFGGLRGRLFY